jgi:hypothetical protein
MDLYRELSTPKNYREIFELLRQKAQEQPYRLHSHPGSKHLSLKWILAAENEIIRFLSGGIRERAYFPQRCTVNEVMLDKKRRLYSLCWPDRIMDALLGRRLGQLVEPHLSPCVFSYRPGFSSHGAIRMVGAYMLRRHAQRRPVYVVKRDISQYCEKIDLSIMLGMLKPRVGPQEEYIWRLIESFVSPRCLDPVSGKEGPLELGVPVGCAVVPACANLYLTELDQAMSREPEGLYCRYGDDIVVAHSDAAVLARLSGEMEEIVARLKLEFKQEKRRDLVLAEAPPAARAPYRPVRSFDYVGFNVNFAGEIFLSQKKINALQAEFRRTAKHAFLANRRFKLSKPQLVDAVISSLNIYLKRRLEHPYISFMLATITNLEALKQLDKWIAKLSLRYVYGTGHDRVFRYHSYQELRRRGLVSLLSLRNMALRSR